MKFIFWLAVTIEGSAFFYYLIQIWVLYKKKQEIGYTPRYDTVVLPAIVLGSLFLGSLIAKYYFKSDKYATIVALIPLAFMVFAFLAMIFATIFLKGNNH
ncbi:hypothetical protein [Dyadobacter sp. CY323]|uniref:hypothetical protein n=1 Tax=Dyadobacter sp. CY323 TaxID=2907302 RepID=UPI001F1E8E0D|nr:hypothetical protein [Dyadobacter sp. CY323]MCE6989922.1 hypothetical protein [Dyadobacter sp. CY323]